MKQRAVLIALAVVCLVTMVGLGVGWGWQGSERASGAAPCFDIKVHPIAARHTYLVNRCTGETWQLQRGSDDNLSWMPLRRYPTEMLELFESLGEE